jgi:signal transduction histidine kinase
LETTHHSADETGSPDYRAKFAGVIHDVNNLLFSAICTAEIMAGEFPVGHYYQKRLQMIIEVTRKCINLLISSQVNEPLSGTSSNMKIELELLIYKVVSWTSCRKAENITVDIRSDLSGLVLYGDEAALGSALMNLIINAFEAMPDGGNLQIYTSVIDGENQNTSGIRKKIANIVVRDTGIGISPQKIPFIFNPFYTTKLSAESPHRGLGLYRTKLCVNAHGGTIDVESTPLLGTTITVQLPITDKK